MIAIAGVISVISVMLFIVSIVMAYGYRPRMRSGR